MRDLEILKRRVGLALRGFSPDLRKDTDFCQFEAYEPPREDFPVPGLVLVVLRDIMGFPWSGQDEKVCWSVYCMFSGEPLAFEHRKFGFTVRHAPRSSLDLKMALARLKKATRLAEGMLQNFAEIQANKGNVSIANLFYALEGRYSFFRQKAEEAYVAPDPSPTPIKFDNDGKPTAWEGTFMKGPREGSFYTAAMIDAFFSRLEHLLVLVLPFIAFDPKGARLRDFIASTWDDKFKGVFDVNRDARSKRIYDRLKLTKVQLRNPLSHGAFEKGWASLYFHLDGIGAIPASLSQFRNSLQFNLLPVEQSGHNDVCALFDEVDDLFTSAHTKMGYEYATSGLDVAFDEASRAAYRQAMQSTETLAAFIEQQSYAADIHANMDY